MPKPPHMPRQATIEIPSPKVNRISFRKDKGLKFRSYMIRVKSIKKERTKQKDMPVRGEVLATKKENKQSQEANMSTCKLRHKTAQDKSLPMR